MRVSQLLVQHSTEHDDDLLARASYIHRVGNGLYSLLPLGNRVLQRINSIVRRELERVGAQEVTMPLLQPQWLWQQRISAGATRAEAFGPQLFHVRGGSGENLILAPTHEEMATLLGAACIRGSCDLPRIIFQIQPRFRDHDVAPRAGLLRTREFVMADAYSLHADEDGLLEGYAAMKCAFRKVLAACGVDAAAVKASSGAMGGGPSEELIAPLPKAATVTAIKCAGCGYAASLQVADFRRECPREHELLPLKEIDSLGGDGPDRARELVASASNQLSCVPFVAGRNVVLTVVPRHLLLNGDKLVAVLSQTNIDLAGFHQGSAEELTRLGGDWDWISLLRTPPEVFVIADESVRTGSNFVFLSPRSGHYLVNVNSGRDFRVDMFADLAVAGDGHVCIRCGGRLSAICGTEVAHLFKLGECYAAALGACSESSKPLQMGCYGLGITRLMSTIVQQNQDERGIVWPHSVAPYTAIIIPATRNASCREFSEELYRMLSNCGVEVLLDDSDDLPETRFAYADLLGIPMKIIATGELQPSVEIRQRKSAESQWVHAHSLVPLLQRHPG